MALLVTALLMTLIPLNGAINIDQDGALLTGSTISLVCKIPTFTGTAGWKNSAISSSTIHSCTSLFCLPSNPTYPRYSFATTTNTFTLNITGVTLDDVNWTCEQDIPAGSHTVSLQLKVAPTTCNLTESGGVYTCTVSCGYQKDDVYITAKLNGTTKTEALSSLMAESTPACTSPESAYSAIVPTTFFTQDGDLYCETGINGYPASATSNSLQVKGTPTTPAPSPCRCGWDWLPCDWECYYFYIIIAAVVVVMVFLLVVGVCCCCRCSDDDAEAYVCCMRKKKSRKDSVNLNENENGQKNVPRSSENGRQVNPSESGKENTSESPCHNNPAYFESEGTDM
ncbi:uncharacterized protein [Argopecten irradians]|uniref:uncharacterized protein n=1 Tax=Argopecten irradians TaxID=31199 RepID=UPI00371E5288